MGARLEIPPFVPEIRWLDTRLKGIPPNSSNPVVGRVYLQQFEITTAVTIDAISVVNNSPVAGNVRVGIYGPITTNETCLGAPLVVESASTALSGANSPQVIDVAPSTIYPGQYYVAIQYDNATHALQRHTGVTCVVGWGQYYDRGGGYGAFTNPCPAVTNSAAIVPGTFLRCSI